MLILGRACNHTGNTDHTEGHDDCLSKNTEGSVVIKESGTASCRRALFGRMRVSALCRCALGGGAGGMCSQVELGTGGRQREVSTDFTTCSGSYTSARVVTRAQCRNGHSFTSARVCPISTHVQCRISRVMTPDQCWTSRSRVMTPGQCRTSRVMTPDQCRNGNGLYGLQTGFLDFIGDEVCQANYTHGLT